MGWRWALDQPRRRWRGRRDGREAPFGWREKEGLSSALVAVNHRDCPCSDPATSGTRPALGSRKGHASGLGSPRRRGTRRAILGGRRGRGCGCRVDIWWALDAHAISRSPMLRAAHRPQADACLVSPTKVSGSSNIASAPATNGFSSKKHPRFPNRCLPRHWRSGEGLRWDLRLAEVWLRSTVVW